MAQITVRAAARVLGLRLGQVATYEETSLLRNLIEAGKLVDVTPSPELVDDGVMILNDLGRPAATEPGDLAETASRAKHPAGRRRSPVDDKQPETTKDG